MDFIETNEGGAMFNTGLATAMEIRKLLNECNYFARTGRFEDWYNTLLVLEREVTPEMKKDDGKKIDKMRTDLLAAVSAQIVDPSKTNAAFKLLHNFEIEIRQIIKKRGLGMPDKDDPGLAIAQSS